MGFNVPSNNQITRHQPVSPSVWTRQADWVTITGVSTGEVIFLVSDATDAKYTIRTTSTGGGNIYIDWGDGSSPDTISSGSATDTEHTFTTGGTSCTLGYNTWKVTLTSDSGTRITQAQIILNSGQYSEYPSGLLEAWYGDTTITSAASYFSEQATPVVPWMTYLEYVKLPNGMTATDSLYRTFFNGCRMLKKVEMPTSCPDNQSLDTTFYECNSLIEVTTMPQDMTGITTCNQLFYNCYALQRVVYPPTLPNCTDVQRIHQNNSNLGECILPVLEGCTNWALAFGGCVSLKSINIPKWKSSGTITLDNMFTSCIGLEQVTFPTDTPSTTSISILLMFNSCFSLKSLIFPPNVKLTGSMSGAFNQCGALVYVSLPIDATSVTSFATTFASCNTLQTITLPSIAPSVGVPMNSMFNSCYALDQVTIPSGYTITTLEQAFRTCRSLKSVTLPNNSQNSLTTMAQMCDACSKLKTIVMPTSMTALTSLSAAFQACYSLESVVFPSSLSSLTTMSQCFNNCYSLEVVTLPTTVGSLTNFSSVFGNCNRLKEVTLPTTFGTPTLTSTFQNCFSLKSVIFGTTRLTNVASLASTFNGCRSLTGITNSDYIGNNSTSTTTYVNGTTMGTDARSLQSLSFSCKFSKLELQGTTGSGNQSQLTSLRLLNNGAGQYGGTTPQINVSYTSMDATALNQLFTDLPTISSKTISVVGCPGAATCNTSIATAKGWTVTIA